MQPSLLSLDGHLFPLFDVACPTLAVQATQSLPLRLHAQPLLRRPLNPFLCCCMPNLCCAGHSFPSSDVACPTLAAQATHSLPLILHSQPLLRRPPCPLHHRQMDNQVHQEQSSNSSKKKRRRPKQRQTVLLEGRTWKCESCIACQTSAVEYVLQEVLDKYCCLFVLHGTTPSLSVYLFSCFRNNNAFIHCMRSLRVWMTGSHGLTTCHVVV